jgi:hypothetical protein
VVARDAYDANVPTLELGSARSNEAEVGRLAAAVQSAYGSSRATLVELSGLFANPRPTSFMQVVASVVKALEKGEARKRPDHAPPRGHRKIHLTADQMQDLVARYLCGSTTVELAAQYDIHYTTVSKYLKDRGVATRLKSLPKHDVTLAIDLYRAGHSTARVAERIGCAPNTIRASLLAAGVEMRDSLGRDR